MWLTGTLLLAMTWRVVMAALLPALSRDGVNFCWMARDLGRRGPAWLATPAARQHPLLSMLILAAERTTRSLTGAAESPLLWQRCGQGVSLAAGLAVVVLTGLLARALARRLDRHNCTFAPAAALLFAALTPLNIELSADVMSDQLHLAFYLAALLFMLPATGLAATGVGLCAGLAYLTRPEGAALLPAGAIGLWIQGWHARRQMSVPSPTEPGKPQPVAPRERSAMAVLALQTLILIVAFLLPAGPFWLASGKISLKKTPLDGLEKVRAAQLGAGHEMRDIDGGFADQPEMKSASVAAGLSRKMVAARLRIYDVPPHELPLWVSERVLHAGRYALPIAAIVTVWVWRRRLAQAALAGPLIAFALHAGLLFYLLHKHGYLEPRHTLPLLAPLTACAAVGIGALPPGRRGAALLVCCAPLAFYSLRVPNGDQGYLREAAAWLSRHDPHIGDKLITGGNTHMRVAFYADAQWRYFLEEPEDFPRIRHELLTARPDYFLLETGDEAHYERRGNARLLDRLREEPELGPRLREIGTMPIIDAWRPLARRSAPPGSTAPLVSSAPAVSTQPPAATAPSAAGNQLHIFALVPP